MQFEPDCAAPPTAAEIATLSDNVGLVAAINQADQAVVITDRDGNIAYVNTAFTRRKSEEALALLAAIVNSSDNAITATTS